jgi:F-type H+-transporting ATPase subunit delta
MQENLTIARPYAQAAFKQAREQGSLGGWSDVLVFLAAVVSDPLMQQVIRNPRIPPGTLAEVVLSVGGDRLFPAARNFVHVLVDAERLLLAPQIASLYAELRAEAERVAPVELTTAYPLEDSDKARIQAALEQRFARKVVLGTSVDAGLIGGVVIHAGDSVIDASVRGRLNQLAQRLA